MKNLDRVKYQLELKIDDLKQKDIKIKNL